jgi:hypothetical protein
MTTIDDEWEDTVDRAMTDRAVQPEATTKAGQAMEAWLREPENYEWGRKVTNAILAIEAEARAAAQERPPIDVVRLAKAMALVYVTGHPIHEAVEHWESYRTDATELIAAYGAAEELDD